MAYTHVWTTAAPLGTAALSTGDDVLRKLRLDFQERMETIVGTGNWDDDPVTMTGTKYYYLHWSAFVIFSASATTSVVNGGLRRASGGTDYCYGTCPIPRGATVTGFDVMGSTGAATCEVVVSYRKVDGTPTDSELATKTISAGSAQGAYSSGTLSMTKPSAADYVYYYWRVYFNATTNACDFHGIRITYTVPDIGTAI